MQTINTNKPAFGANLTGGNVNPVKPAGILAATVAGVPLGTALPATKPTGKRAKADKPAKPAPIATVKHGGFTDGNIKRTADTAGAMRYPYNAASSRDDAYTAFFALASREHGTGPDKLTVTFAALASYTVNPLYSGSNKPHDAGAIERAAKRQHITCDATARTITLTTTGLADGRALLAKLAKPTTPAKP